MPWTHTLREFAQAVGAEVPAHDTAFSRICTDTRSLLQGDLFLALRGENFDGNQFLDEALQKGAVGVVAQEGTAKGPAIRVPDGLAALQRFAAWHRAQFDIPVIAITGSCGKTTAKDLTAAVLATRGPVAKTAGNLNNEIGLPQSLLNIDAATSVAVLEMGANHMGEIAALCELARPAESAITLVAPAHLEGFGSIENVARAKGEIMEALGGAGCFYVNNDNAYCRDIGARHHGDKMTFGVEGDVALRQITRLDSGELELDIAPVGQLRLPLPVRAHATNVLLAIAVGLRHGVDAKSLEPVLRQACAGLTRFRVLTLGPLRVLDDSYNANPASMRAALEALMEQPGTGLRMAALGSMLEMGASAAALHRDVGRAAAELGVTHLYTRGPNAEDLAAGALEAGMPVAEAVDDHAAMGARIASAVEPGSVLLVKGSRGMRMERVIDALRPLLAPGLEGG
jgi:UDP-N-acetylmuramoyl-tripeptide--D-alanyl-D-alanine ligase